MNKKFVKRRIIIDSDEESDDDFKSSLLNTSIHNIDKSSSALSKSLSNSPIYNTDISNTTPILSSAVKKLAIHSAPPVLIKPRKVNDHHTNRIYNNNISNSKSKNNSITSYNSDEEVSSGEIEWDSDSNVRDAMDGKSSNLYPVNALHTGLRIIGQRIGQFDDIEYLISFPHVNSITSPLNSTRTVEEWFYEQDVDENWNHLKLIWNEKQSNNSKNNQNNKRDKSNREASFRANKLITDINSRLNGDNDDNDDSDDNNNKRITNKRNGNEKKRRRVISYNESESEFEDEEDDNFIDNDIKLTISSSYTSIKKSNNNKKNNCLQSPYASGKTNKESSISPIIKTRESTRSKALSKAQESKRLSSLNELRLKSKHGLSALSTDEDDDNDYYSLSEEEQPSKRVINKDLNLFDFYHPPKKNNNYSKENVEVNVSDSNDNIDSDMDNFIVNSEDEREERRERREERRIKKDLKISKKKSRPTDNDTEKTSSNSKRRRIIIEDDEEKEFNADNNIEEEEEEEEEYDDDNNDDDDDDDSDDSEDDSEDVNGSLQYWQLNAIMDEKKDKASYSLPTSYSRTQAMKIYIELLANVHVNEKFLSNLAKDTYSEASIKYYAALRQIENLICTSRESLIASGAWKQDFLYELQHRPFYSVGEIPNEVSNQKCEACGRCSHNAIYRVYLFGENYDSRRSWLSNSTWDNEFPNVIFYNSKRNKSNRKDENVIIIDEDDEDDDSDVSSDEEYKNEIDIDDKRVWWKKAWPKELTIQKESTFELAAHCRGRTEMYHSLLHYKFRLMLKIKEKLEFYNGSINRLIADDLFLSRETDRFNRIISNAGVKWGGEGNSNPNDLWFDKEDTARSINNSNKNSIKNNSNSNNNNKMNSTSGNIMNWISKQDNFIEE